MISATCGVGVSALSPVLVGKAYGIETLTDSQKEHGVVLRVHGEEPPRLSRYMKNV